MQLGHGQNNYMFLHMAICQSLCWASALVFLTFPFLCFCDLLWDNFIFHWLKVPISGHRASFTIWLNRIDLYIISKTYKSFTNIRGFAYISCQVLVIWQLKYLFRMFNTKWDETDLILIRWKWGNQTNLLLIEGQCKHYLWDQLLHKHV